MPRIKRRYFIQSAGATLAAIGLSQVDFLRQAHQFDQVNAQAAPRKLALLVGINAYPGHELSGCVNDVRSMQILLEHRYGFDLNNIKVLTDAEATRQAILTAFETHLIAQAKPGDIVVFHFSGHGSMVLDSDPNPGFTYSNQGVDGTLIPYDLDADGPGNLRCIMGHTLFLLMSALKTENVTVVLDSCHSGGGLRGNTIIRSLKVTDNELPPTPKEELDYQQTLLLKAGMGEKEFKQKRKLGIAKGVAIGAAKLDQEAQDVPFNGFYMGAFTYLLTRYLWQSPITQSLDSMFTNLELGTQMLVDNKGAQVPNYEAKPKSTNQQQPIFFSMAPRPAAEAVIHEPPQPGQPIKFWLAGVSPSTLNSYATGAVFNIIDAQGQTIGELEQTTPRNGLEAAGKLRSGNVQVAKGMLLREQIRGVPPNPKLKVGLDPSLDEALPTIQTSLNSVSWLEITPINQKQPVDYIIGRMTAENTKRLQAKSLSLPPTKAISLFTADLTPIPDSFGGVSEPTQMTIDRLRPRLKSLLAGQVLRSILGDTSPLKVSADIFPVDEKNNPLGKGRTLASRGLQAAAIKTQSVQTQPIKLGTSIGVQIKNNEQSNLYVAAIVISDSGEMGVLFPFGADAPEAASLVEGGKTKQIPVPFQASSTPGFVELLLLMSREPLRDALRALQTIARGRGVRGLQPAGLEADEADAFVNNLLGDVDRSSRSAMLTVPSSYKTIDAGKLAALSAVFQVVR